MSPPERTNLGHAAPILSIEDLKTYFFTPDAVIKAVDGVSLQVHAGESIGVVGESGSGKTVTALSILRLVKEPGRIVNGRILLTLEGEQRDIVQMDADELRRLRGNKVAMIFQDPMASFNPVLRTGRQIEEAMRAHDRFGRRSAKERTGWLLNRVRIPGGAQRARDYPHQFSGGMLQRAMVAMGLSNEPNLLIADEPTTALDVTVQAQIIALLKTLNRESRTAIVLITHNLAVVAGLCSRVIVMYAGRIVEQGETRQIFKNPQHPYTWLLLRSLPRAGADDHDPLLAISGSPPDPADEPSGCKFHPRCPFVQPRCVETEPSLDEVEPAHAARCWVLMKNADPKRLAELAG